VFAGKQSPMSRSKNPQMRGILVTPIGTLTDIDTLLLFRKRPKGTIPVSGCYPQRRTAQTAQPE
jgi:hypothetical protein